MLDILLTDKQRQLRAEVDDFVRSVPRQLLLDMDADRVRYPRHYLEEAARRNLLGLRFPAAYGGRDLGWADEILALDAKLRAGPCSNPWSTGRMTSLPVPANLPCRNMRARFALVPALSLSYQLRISCTRSAMSILPNRMT